ncbi:AraC family transcriptional regulator [Lactiplantibacillus fabifermentans]|uniref:Transcription regulator n=2 Tax=Lactiplantibacillus fabifermentans TaxID=483011 RepID=A0A0R2NNM1_9LACO|nr:AraC family transcriptional regulator [Lactiplantibacillus fabifermentans]ETY72929.1 DNA-binding protein [Lactiplantibacillus fabifermentans T30PCM01]KRO27305.1 transcription regulator [Lactiplantibacillus fabifermentans DSM 21115]
MDLVALDAFLRSEDPIETQQRLHGGNVVDVKITAENNGIPQMPKADFFKRGNIFVNKHHRYSYMPAHTHSFVELNYMYSGHSTQYINGEKIELHEHELILMDKDIVQQIDYVGENDILINILIRDDSILTNILNNLSQSKNLATEFMINASRVNAVHNNFVVFNLRDNEMALSLINNLIIKGLGHAPYRNRSMNLLLSLILTELANSIEVTAQEAADNNDDLAQILSYIDRHFTSLTLRQLGTHFGYNQNYLGNKLKAETGSTFKALIDKKRLAEAEELLLETNYSVAEIAERIGYHSTPSLFKLFNKHLQLTPIQFKRQRENWPK